ncbi:MAG: hypothetical protein KGQ26_03420 [Rhodospirillales bacterium]|nr:hypothetical protein [Rhodospirillales bacterium]MDE2319567.1 hypothetical protein [Rhodospirillales bacterium]
MSGTSYLTVAGGGTANIHSGVLSIPSSLGTTVNSLLQTYLDGVSGSVGAATAGFENYNAVNGAIASVGGAGINFLEEITNTDSVGNTVSGAPLGGVVSVNPAATTLVVQAPGNLTISGSSSTSAAVFGSASNVAYSVSGGAGSIFAAGGNDSVYAKDAAETVTSAGNDTLTFASATTHNEVINAVGNATTRVYVGGADIATVTASDSSQASVVFLTNAGGSLDFINSSSKAQTIYSGSYTTAGGGSIYATNAVTAFGGSGGGFFVGGRGGFNLLNGGTGNSTLVGGGANDTLISGGVQNYLYTGVGAETLMGGGVSNVFQVGLENVGIGMTSAVGDLVSAGGSGAQDFLLGNLAATTLTGSTVTGASNVYDILGAVSTGSGLTTLGGSTLTITDFGASDHIYLIDNTGFGPNAPTFDTMQAALGGGGTNILLSDGTQITLKGVSTSNISVSGSGHVITLT